MQDKKMCILRKSNTAGVKREPAFEQVSAASDVGFCDWPEKPERGTVILKNVLQVCNTTVSRKHFFFYCFIFLSNPALNCANTQ